MACEPATNWESMGQSANSMEHQNLDIITSALFGDSSVMLSAVASLLTRHQCSKEHDTSLTLPQLNLTSTPSKDSVLADVILGTAHTKSGVSPVAAAHDTENSIPIFEQVHALATANLVASTQRDIAKQLAEANKLSHAGFAAKSTKQNARKEPDQEQKDALKKSKPENLKKVEKKRTSSKLTFEQSTTAVVDGKSSGFSEPKALVCSYEGCDRKFAWLNHLKYHELTHTNNRQFKCPEDSCGKTFFTAQRLSVHQRTHTGEKPFRCLHQDCGKTFTTAGNLKNHQRIHTGEQPFVCDHINCNRRFTEQSSLRKHKLTHSGDKPFECKICGKKFTQSGSRRQHLIRHHLDDEIRHSFKQEGTEKDAEDDDMVNDERKEGISTGTSCSHTLQSEPGAVNAVSCSPQVLVLNNAYPSLSSADSIVLSHGLGDHLVTVKTEVVDDPMSQSQSISLSHTLLSSDGFHDAVLHGKSDDFVVLSQAPIYDHDDSPADIVYTTDILDHEEVTHADYVTSHVDYSGESTHSNYSSHRELTHSDDFTHPEFSHPDSYITHGGDITVAEYVATDCIQQDCGFTDPKSLPHSYLDSDREVVHAEFIGAEEVTTAHHSRSPCSDPPCIDNSSAEFSQTRAATLTDYVRTHYPAKLDNNFTLGKATFIGHPSCHLDSSFMVNSAASNSGHSLVVVEVTGHSSHIIHADSVSRNMRMDPLMECDEEPDRHNFLPVS